ncbi:hypothetical protein GGS24DRAFT_200383 [Hypoxylon argillaceum]|nr:hypothetical protein GGS24DRAFT_200383 [Hypoxylon argillaceum]
MQFVPTPKSTPNRRRPPTGRNRNSSQKIYASENDLPSERPNNTVSPSTPQKLAPGGTAAPRAQSTNQKQKNKGNKNRNTKNGVASPGRRQGRESPSLQPQVASAHIFAGSTFHASPAPSALPLPSFLRLSGADSSMDKSKTTESANESSPLTDSDEGSPADKPIPRNEESPLEFFFRADRAEKALGRRASSANIDSVPTARLSPLRNSPHKECNTFPKAMGHNSARRPIFTGSDTSPSIPTTGLDISSRLPVGPAFSTPYHERIRAAHSNQNSARSTPVVNRNPDPNSSEALKRYLFTGQFNRLESHEPSNHFSQSPQVPHVAQQQYMSDGGRQQSAHQASQRSLFPAPNVSRGMFPASTPPGHAPRTQATPPVRIDNESSPRPDHILALEGDLRRVLKLDSVG